MDEVTCPACGTRFDPAAPAVRVTEAVESWDGAKHPRVSAGASGGGQFASASSGGAAKSQTANARTAKTGTAKTAKAGTAKTKVAKSGGTLSYNGKTGTGYGSKNGDPRVRRLQEALNRLGLTDGKGRKLAVDG